MQHVKCLRRPALVRVLESVLALSIRLISWRLHTLFILSRVFIPYTKSSKTIYIYIRGSYLALPRKNIYIYIYTKVVQKSSKLSLERIHTHTHTHTYIYITFFLVIYIYNQKWCNGYRRRKWTDYISHSTNTLVKGMNPIILPPARLNSRADSVLQPWWGN